MRGVDITENVSFKSCVHGDEAEAAYDFRIVGYFSRTDEHLVAEESDVAEEAVHCLVGECQRAGAGEAAFAFLHQVDYRVLNHFGVHFELRDF